MLRFVIPAFCLCCCSGMAMVPQDAPPASAKQEVSAEEKLVDEILKVYTDVFNKHDAKGLAHYWSAKCTSCNSETGTRLTGREAVQAAFEEFFKNDPQCRLTARIKHFRFLKPDLLTLEGESVLSSADKEPNENQFTLLLVKVGDKWEIEHAQESSIPVPETAYDSLKSLEWLVGDWADDSQGVKVESQISWNAKKTFLIRKYSIIFDNEPEADTGTQIIGWDPRSKTIRSWTFSADGSFGDGAWTNTENEWRVKFNHTNSDGIVESGTQVITRVDDQTANVQLIGQEIEGELKPAAPAVKMVRKPAATTSEEPKK